MAGNMKSGGDFCAAINCTNSRNKQSCIDRKISFHAFPREEARCRVWIQNSRRQDLQGLSLEDILKKRLLFCSEHFEENQFNCAKELSNSARRTLNWNAVPTLFKVPNPPPSTTTKRKNRERACSEVAPKKMKPCSLSQETPMVDEALLEDPSPASASNSKQLKCNDVKQKLKKDKE
ncbi:THAP domain-containing protein 7 [Plakobranchus ocellatus]|uniref:THAP domain-containing protein 7 n=1 Tax=Plakobranchus ocellatus TaxID=259542 RepID=A0AAV4AJW7_9GAST|nr:THAP domain-containing protein 7 [Plakobranchus ocellatus]